MTQDIDTTVKPIKNSLAYFNLIDTFFFDVDGVMTDGKLISTIEGEFLRTFHSRDGFAIRHAIEQGYNIVVITGGKGKTIENRLVALGIKTYFINAQIKLPIFERYCKEHDIDTSRALYMGDDLNDYEVMQHIGLACCPADAATEIKKTSQYISPFNGGDGCVRDVIEKVMKLHGKWMNNISVISG